MTPYYRVYSNESTAAEHVETLEQAQARAEELAAKHPGRAFEILRCVGIAQTSRVSTFWMDGEGPSQHCQSDYSPRYRTLEVGEMVKSGDEWEANEPGVWEPREYRGEQAPYMQPTRRPL